MKDLIDLLLRSFETHEIIYKGPIYSNNDAQSKHWRKKASLVKKYKIIFRHLILAAKLPWFEEFALVVYFNSRHDTDNISSTAKIFVDCLRQRELKGKIIQKGYVKDDSKKYYKMLAILPDDSLKKHEFKFKLIKIK